MSKSVLIWVVGATVAVVAAGGVIVATRDDKNDQANPASNNTAQQSQADTSGNSNSTQATTPSTQNEIEIEDFAFKPVDITVKKGTKVTWTNKDDVVHTATSDSGSTVFFDSGNLSKGESFSFTFNQAGAFNYHCTPHPTMTGSVTVTD